MKTVIYSKFSAERSRSFAIRTDILCADDGSRMLRKTACFPEGDGPPTKAEKSGFPRPGRLRGRQASWRRKQGSF